MWASGRLLGPATHGGWGRLPLSMTVAQTDNLSVHLQLLSWYQHKCTSDKTTDPLPKLWFTAVSLQETKSHCRSQGPAKPRPAHLSCTFLSGPQKHDTPSCRQDLSSQPETYLKSPPCRSLHLVISFLPWKPSSNIPFHRGSSTGAHTRPGPPFHGL